tara:strand:+ start:919 stop:1410 length:492 start_codon:yes stop_codon:yes gene_type:complete
MTGQPRPINDYLDSVRDLDRAVFLVRSAPFLLLIQTPGGVEADQVATASEVNLRGGLGLVVAPLAKRPGANNFPDMITVGRTPNNDVWLANPGVSKFHAYFVSRAHTISLVDANSSRGTFYGEHRLAPNSRIPLHSGATVAFGPLRGTLLTAEDFYDLRVSPD